MSIYGTTQSLSECILILCVKCNVLVVMCKQSVHTVDAEMFVGEIFRGLNFQEIQFSCRVASIKLWTQHKFCLRKISHVQNGQSSHAVPEGSLCTLTPCIQGHLGSGSWWNSCVRARTREFSWQKRRCSWERWKNLCPFATEGIMRLCFFFLKIGGIIHSIVTGRW